MAGWESARSVGIVLLATLAGIGALYVGREFFIPIAVALLLNGLLRPLVRGLERWRVPDGGDGCTAGRVRGTPCSERHRRAGGGRWLSTSLT